MSDQAQEERKVYYVKLQKNFPVAHRRAGVVLSPGPIPERVELTQDQWNEIDRDPAFVFVDEKDVETILDAQSTLDTVDDTPAGNRNYGDTPQETPEEKADREAKEEAAAAEVKRRAETPTAEELVKDNRKEDLIAKANELGVEDLNYEDRGTTMKVIAEAIVAKRDANVEE